MKIERCPICSHTNEDDEHCRDKWHEREDEERPFANTYGLEAPQEWEYKG